MTTAVSDVNFDIGLEESVPEKSKGAETTPVGGGPPNGRRVSLSGMTAMGAGPGPMIAVLPPLFDTGRQLSGQESPDSSEAEKVPPFSLDAAPRPAASGDLLPPAKDVAIEVQPVQDARAMPKDNASTEIVIPV